MRMLHLPQPPELEVHIRAPPPQTLHHDAAAEMLSVSPTERQAVSQTGQTAGVTARARYGVQSVGVAVAELEHLFVAKGREAVGPDVVEVLGRYATPVIADADRDAG